MAYRRFLVLFWGVEMGQKLWIQKNTIYKRIKRRRPKGRACKKIKIKIKIKKKGLLFRMGWLPVDRLL
jgi:uncharacterized metal-binding protein